MTVFISANDVLEDKGLQPFSFHKEILWSCETPRELLSLASVAKMS